MKKFIEYTNRLIKTFLSTSHRTRILLVKINLFNKLKTDRVPKCRRNSHNIHLTILSFLHMSPLFCACSVTTKLLIRYIGPSSRLIRCPINLHGLSLFLFQLGIKKKYVGGQKIRKPAIKRKTHQIVRTQIKKVRIIGLNQTSHTADIRQYLYSEGYIYAKGNSRVNPIQVQGGKIPSHVGLHTLVFVN